MVIAVQRLCCGVAGRGGTASSAFAEPYMNSKEPVPPHIRMPASRNLLIVDDDCAQARLFEFLLSKSRVRTDVIIRRADSRLSSFSGVAIHITKSRGRS